MCLMYDMVCTRPDLAHIVSMVSKFLSNSRRQHWDIVKWIFRYLRGTANYGIMFSRQHGNPSVMRYIDADYAGNLDDMRSTTSYVFTLVGEPICWNFIFQSLVALSTIALENITMVEATKEALWLTSLVKEMRIQKGGVQLHCDN